MKKLLNCIGLELKRITRNKLLLILMLIVPIFFAALCCVAMDKETLIIGVVSEIDNEESYLDAFDSLENEIEFVHYDDLEEANKDVLQGDITFLMHLYDNEGIPSCRFSFDISQVYYVDYKIMVVNYSFENAYNSIKNVMKEDYGFTIKEEYFKSISTGSTREGFDDNGLLNYPLIMSAILGACLIFVLMYLTSRDNENNTTNFLCYMPLSRHFYLLSKIIPMLIIGVVEAIIYYGAFYLFFPSMLMGNFVIYMLLNTLFIIDILAFGLLINSFRSQVITTLITITSILLPVYLISLRKLSTLLLPFKCLAYMFPITAYYPLQSRYMFNNVTMWWSIPLLVGQAILYYFLSYLVLAKKTNNYRKKI